MTGRPPFGIPNRPRIRHSWRCTQRAGVIEAVQLDDTGHATVVIHRCEECGADDLLDRLRDQRRST